MQTTDLVSIITPMYKGAAFVGETIESVLAQSYQNWEMIIVDDCSPDDGTGIAEVNKYTSDPRIKLIASKENRGSSGARNIALKEAKGRYIAFLDSDDIWHHDFLEKQLNYMKKCNAPLVFSSYRRIDENTKEELLKPFIVPSKVSYRSLLKTCPIFPSTAIYDTQKTPKIFFNEELGSMRDDYVYWLKMLKDIDYGYGNPEILVDYRMRKSSVTGNKSKVIVPQWNVLHKVEKLGLIRSAYYLGCWAIISYFKYQK
ncbi:glycosyltransferase family 2 protein [Sangeribacter muris]|jgi:glycosyltransferase involved in cell wall biosynthesis|uniref:glycosyltransferase family 2 protein n=1 Tax=Sangeribacter muris TaxID=2880703 RepID=UPI001A2C722C|nr:glycosyltransferase family 2 protein [Sangeribacter muris]MBJ2193420.1 glycosyltransferase family 2 protein [Muribaculaceae bacterium]